MSAGFFSRFGRVAALIGDPRTPKLPKLAILAAVIYIISPVDLIPEAVLPVVGWLDDVLIGLAALRFLLKQDPPGRESDRVHGGAPPPPPRG